MGMYDTFGNVQIKSGRCAGYQFEVGDDVAKSQVDDGIHVGYGGAIVIVDSIFVAEFETLTNKWGGDIEVLAVINAQNPVTQALDALRDDLPEEVSE